MQRRDGGFGGFRDEDGDMRLQKYHTGNNFTAYVRPESILIICIRFFILRALAPQ